MCILRNVFRPFHKGTFGHRLLRGSRRFETSPRQWLSLRRRHRTGRRTTGFDFRSNGSLTVPRVLWERWPSTTCSQVTSTRASPPEGVDWLQSTCMFTSMAFGASYHIQLQTLSRNQWSSLGRKEVDTERLGEASCGTRLSLLNSAFVKTAKWRSMEHVEDVCSTTSHSITGAGASKNAVRREKRGRRMGAITIPISSMSALE